MSYGKLLQDFGTVFTSAEVSVVHHSIHEKGVIPSHNHPGEQVFFTVVKGELEVFLDEVQKFYAVPGSVLTFDGSHRLSATAIKESEIFVFLVKKEDE